MVLSQTVILGMMIIGATLIIAEAFIPGADLLVVGFTLFVTSLVAWSLPWLSIPIIFVISVIVAVGSFYLYHNYITYGNEKGKTSDSSDLEYTEGTVVEKVTKTSGRVQLEEGSGMSTVFQARSPEGEIEEGTEVIVTDSGGGSILEVVPTEEKQMDKMYNLE